MFDHHDNWTKTAHSCGKNLHLHENGWFEGELNVITKLFVKAMLHWMMDVRIILAKMTLVGLKSLCSKNLNIDS